MNYVLCAQFGESRNAGLRPCPRNNRDVGSYLTRGGDDHLCRRFIWHGDDQRPRLRQRGMMEYFGVGGVAIQSWNDQTLQFGNACCLRIYDQARDTDRVQNIYNVMTDAPI